MPDQTENLRAWIREHAWNDGEIVSTIGHLDVVIARMQAQALRDVSEEIDGMRFLNRSPYTDLIKERALRILREEGIIGE